MTASNKKIIVVVGATGNQGSSVANTFLTLPNWHVRCFTRSPDSAASKDLRARGAEIVKGDLEDPASIDKAFENANAIFVNTDYWVKYTNTRAEGKGPEEASRIAVENETRNARNAVIAAAAVPSLERFVYSAFVPIKKASNGKYTHVYHFEVKASIVDFVENEQPELAKKSSFIYVGTYSDLYIVTPVFDPASGKYILKAPLEKKTKLPIINPKESVGPLVRALIEDEAPNTKLLAYDSYLSVEELLEKWSKASGKEVTYIHQSIDDLLKDPNVPIEAADIFSYVNEFSYTAGVEGIIEPPQLKKKDLTKSYEDWLKGRNWEEVEKMVPA